MTRVFRRSLLVSCIGLFLVFAGSGQVKTRTTFVCPMHAEVTSNTPGKCPRCSMDLVAVRRTSAARKRHRITRVKRNPISNEPVPEPSPSTGNPPRNWATLSAAEQIRERERLAPTYDYTCVMHSQIHKAQQGTCPICGMELVSVNPSIRGKYKLELMPTPWKVTPGQKLRLHFKVFQPMTGAKVKRFVVNHDKLYHLFVVSEDMNEYQHIHPQLGTDGSFTVETVLPRPGLYKLHSDFFPVDGTPQVIALELPTAGYRRAGAKVPTLLPETTLEKVVDGVRVSFSLSGHGEPVAGSYVLLKYHLSDAASGVPIVDLEPYLGAWGHTLILNADQSTYLHSHPTETVNAGPTGKVVHGGPDVEFGAMFPEGGNYRVWTQFQRGGKVMTASFTIRVRAETP